MSSITFSHYDIETWNNLKTVTTYWNNHRFSKDQYYRYSTVQKKTQEMSKYFIEISYDITTDYSPQLLRRTTFFFTFIINNMKSVTQICIQLSIIAWFKETPFCARRRTFGTVSGNVQSQRIFYFHAATFTPTSFFVSVDKKHHHRMIPPPQCFSFLKEIVSAVLG